MLFSKLWVWLLVYTKTTFSSVFLFLFQKLVKDLFDFRFSFKYICDGQISAVFEMSLR